MYNSLNRYAIIEKKTGKVIERFRLKGTAYLSYIREIKNGIFEIKEIKINENSLTKDLGILKKKIRGKK